MGRKNHIQLLGVWAFFETGRFPRCPSRLSGEPPERRYNRRSRLGITSSHSTKRSLPYLLVYRPTRPRGANSHVISHRCHDVSYPNNPPNNGNVATSRQTPLLNTKRLLFHRLVCRRTASESHRHKRNPWIKPSSRCFNLLRLPTDRIASLRNVCKRAGLNEQDNPITDTTSFCTSIQVTHVKATWMRVQINLRYDESGNVNTLLKS